MLPKHLGVIAGVVGVVGVVACSHGLSGACSDYIDADLSYAGRCGGSSSVPAQEKSNFVAFCEVLGTAPGTGDLASQLDDCTNQVKSLDCNASTNCVFRGALPDGAACGAGTQCAGGLCTGAGNSPPNSEVSCGTCSSYVTLGGDCTTAECDPTTGACVQNKCVAYVKQGASCASAPCDSGLQCDSTSNTCQPYPGKGQACTFECAYPEQCVQGTCADPVQQGGACPMGDECASSLTCDPGSHTCVPPTLAGAGEACGFVNSEIIDCQSGLQCQTSTQGAGTCVAPKETGDSCTVGNQECDTFLLCIGGTCQVPDYSVCK